MSPTDFPGVTPGSDTERNAFSIVVPVKPPAQGKSRLGDVPDLAGTSRRAGLARAFALDTIAAALSCAATVVVATDDHLFAREAAGLGCRVIPDGVSGDLNLALAQAAAEAARLAPGAGIAVLCADLPALRAEELAAALSAMPGDGAGFVPDADGTGTVLYAARSLAEFAPEFGFDSARRHADAGAVRLDGDWPGLRRDVDDVASLASALLLGVGTHTARASGRG